MSGFCVFSLRNYETVVRNKLRSDEIEWMVNEIRHGVIRMLWSHKFPLLQYASLFGDIQAHELTILCSRLAQDCNMATMTFANLHVAVAVAALTGPVICEFSKGYGYSAV
ncbi:hypothetical protein IF1G_07585 [Cordyceps javanica]|uniref:Uncharacterized protein n=1 Tax=Cordyceps javanica TaxID=43265 RepID=A0A545UWK9_9HYPO|nr:hypothetical protein IF1G_07585 [Cordyceps javanica]